MTPPDGIIALFSAVDQERLDRPKHPEATLSPSAVVTLALLHASKGGGTRAFSRWLTRDSLPLLPRVPERTRLARLFTTHTAWTARLLAALTVLGVADTSGSELLHPRRAGRRAAHIGQKGQSHQRWILGGQLGFLLHQWGWMCAWDCAPANVYDAPLHPLMAPCEGRMMVLTDTGCHAKTGDPVNRKVCPRGTWNPRRLGATVWSMLTTVLHSQQVGHRVRTSFGARVAWTMAAFNRLAQWGLEIEDEDMVRLSMAAFSL
jgi:hypothetical protein